MSSPLRMSQVRAAAGAVLAVLALGIAFFVLPGANEDLQAKIKAREQADRTLRQQQAELQDLQALADRIQRGRDTLQKLEQSLAKEGVGELQWRLSEKLHQLAQQHGVRLQTVKYGQASREGTKGTELESLEVEFVTTGLYANQKAFMHDLEKSDLPFAVRDGRLEESPEGARLDLVLTAFRRAGAPAARDEEA